MTTVTLPVDFSTLSHELRTPLVGINGAAELFDEQGLSPLQKEQLDIIRESGARLLAFTDMLLTESQKKGNAATNPQWLSASTLLKRKKPSTTASGVEIQNRRTFKI